MSGEDLRHGTISGYRLGCRCDACRSENAEYQREWRRRNKYRRARGPRRSDVDADLRPPPGRTPSRQATHGSRTMYGKGCRCEECREADRIYKRNLRSSRRTELGLTAAPDEWFVGINEGDVSWMERGACRSPKVPTEWFFPKRGSNKIVEQAKAICAGCQVKDECLAYAIRTHQRMGIWGGVAGKDIRTLSAQHRRGEVA